MHPSHLRKKMKITLLNMIDECLKGVELICYFESKSLVLIFAALLTLHNNILTIHLIQDHVTNGKY